MLKRFLALSTALAALLCLDGCTVHINRHVHPTELRYSGFDLIDGAVLMNGDYIEFDRQPPQRAARAIGDTLYAFVEGEFTKIPLNEVLLVDVDRIIPSLDPVGTLEILGQIFEATIDLARVAAPVAVPAIFVLFVWKSFKKM